MPPPPSPASAATHGSPLLPIRCIVIQRRNRNRGEGLGGEAAAPAMLMPSSLGRRQHGWRPPPATSGQKCEKSSSSGGGGVAAYQVQEKRPRRRGPRGDGGAGRQSSWIPVLWIPADVRGRGGDVWRAGTVVKRESGEDKVEVAVKTTSRWRRIRRQGSASCRAGWHRGRTAERASGDGGEEDGEGEAARASGDSGEEGVEGEAATVEMAERPSGDGACRLPWPPPWPPVAIAISLGHLMATCAGREAVVNGEGWHGGSGRGGRGGEGERAADKDEKAVSKTAKTAYGEPSRRYELAKGQCAESSPHSCIR
uniref:DUF834 domain-containing protein n=1 Tax=Oryza glumipatula TaxID=40148 RepID=A0A0E0BHP0_9ORYZ